MKKLSIPFLTSIIAILLVGLAALYQNTYWTSVMLNLSGLGVFILSFLINHSPERSPFDKLSRWIALSAFGVVVINIGTFQLVGDGTKEKESDPTQEPQIQECVSHLKLGQNGWNDTYEEGSKYLPIAPTYYLYMRGKVTATDGGLQATGYVFGKAWYVFWTRWGDVDLELNTTISCEGKCVDEVNNCIADFSTTGNSSRQESIIRGVLEKAASQSDNEVRMTVVLSGSLSAEGGPSIEFGNDPLKVSVSWPNSTAENSFQAGTYKWRCECE